MNNDLTLKFKSETGTSATRKIYASEYDEDTIPSIMPDDEEEMSIPTDEYLEWLEDLALKQLKGSKSIFEAQKIMKKMSSIKTCFESLKSSINSIDLSDVEEYEIDKIKDDCDDLESEIYD